MTRVADVSALALRITSKLDIAILLTAAKLKNSLLGFRIGNALRLCILSSCVLKSFRRRLLMEVSYSFCSAFGEALK